MSDRLHGLPNKPDAANPAMAFLLQAGRHQRRVADLERSPAYTEMKKWRRRTWRMNRRFVRHGAMATSPTNAPGTPGNHPQRRLERAGGSTTVCHAKRRAKANQADRAARATVPERSDISGRTAHPP